jgi:hypothetical protein
VTPPARAERPLAGRHFIVGIRPVRLRGVEGGGLACEAFDWATGGFDLDNSYLSKVISGYGEVDEVSAQEFDAAVERLCIDRGFMARYEPGVLQRVGFFREMPHGVPTGPSLQKARGETALPGEEEIASYLEHGQVHIATPGYGHDVLDPTRRTAPPHYLTDGRFVWPGDLAYYVRNYHVRLPEPFIAHMTAAGWRIPTDIDMTTLRLPPTT